MESGDTGPAFQRAALLMNVLDLFHEGRLLEALAVQRQIVDAAPHDAAARLLLAELLLFAGDLAGVRREIECLPRDRAGMNEYCNAYHQLLDAERQRQRLLLDADPILPLNPSPSLKRRLQAVVALRRDDSNMAQRHLDKADASAPWLTGHVDGREFDGMRDVDELFGPVLETFVDGGYAWLPCEEIRRLRLLEIDSLRDRYFVPALLTTRSADEQHIHLPAFYVGTNFEEVGFGTDFQATKSGPTRATGLRQFLFGEEELSLYDFKMWECRNS